MLPRPPLSRVEISDSEVQGVCDSINTYFSCLTRPTVAQHGCTPCADDIFRSGLAPLVPPLPIPTLGAVLFDLIDHRTSTEQCRMKIVMRAYREKYSPACLPRAVPHANS